MRFIKAFLFGIAGLFIIITLLSLLISGNVKVSRVTLINSTGVKDIYAQVIDLKHWQNWHPMFKPGLAAITYSGNTLGKNAFCEINYHKKITHLVITAADTTAIHFTLQSNGENDVYNTIILTPVPAQQSVQTEWRAITKLHWYPWEKFYAIFLDKLTGPGYETALNSLKEYTEKNK